ncbi:unnamed protein product, partial [Iphiclides podalirius]
MYVKSSVRGPQLAGAPRPTVGPAARHSRLWLWAHLLIAVYNVWERFRRPPGAGRAGVWGPAGRGGALPSCAGDDTQCPRDRCDPFRNRLIDIDVDAARAHHWSRRGLRGGDAIPRACVTASWARRGPLRARGHPVAVGDDHRASKRQTGPQNPEKAGTDVHGRRLSLNIRETYHENPCRRLIRNGTEGKREPRKEKIKERKKSKSKREKESTERNKRARLNKPALGGGILEAARRIASRGSRGHFLRRVNSASSPPFPAPPSSRLGAATHPGRAGRVN